VTSLNKLQMINR